MLLNVAHVLQIFLPVATGHELELHLHAAVGEVKDLLALGRCPVEAYSPLDQLRGPIEVQKDHLHAEVVKHGDNGKNGKKDAPPALKFGAALDDHAGLDAIDVNLLDHLTAVLPGPLLRHLFLHDSHLLEIV
jgi:hypothetical protein